MRRITTATRVPDKFGAGKDGFTDGDVVGGIAATDLNADWFDQVQEELAAVIEAGSIVLNGSVRNQLLQALRAAGVFQTAATSDRSTRVATTAWVGALFAGSLGSSGWMPFPNGVIMQWGQVTLPGTTTNITVSLPTTYPNTPFNAIASDVGATAWGVGAQNISASQISIYVSSYSTNSGALVAKNNPATISWMSFGR